METTVENWGTILLRISEEGIQEVAVPDDNVCTFKVGQQHYQITREMAYQIMAERWMIPFPIRWKMGL
jgi:hypothetical protein